MFSAIVLTYLLLASAVLAAPSLKADRRSNTPQHLDARFIPTNDLAGAVTFYGPGTFTAVTGLITMPSLYSSGSISARVAIDAFSCPNGSFQTGVNSTFSNGGYMTYSAWYKQDPDIFGIFPNISFSPGDSVRLTVNASSLDSGTATIENLTANVTASQDLHSQTALCQQDVEWMVEVGTVIPRFSPFVFSEAAAFISSGRKIGPSGSNLVEVVRAGLDVNSTVDLASGSVIVALNSWLPL